MSVALWNTSRGTTEKIDLLCTCPVQAFTEPQHIFAQMLRLAQPLMTNYRSDLWHDAMYLQEHFSRVDPETGGSFHWYISPTHTWIGPHAVKDPYTHTTHYKMTLALNDKRWWELTIEVIAEKAAA